MLQSLAGNADAASLANLRRTQTTNPGNRKHNVAASARRACPQRAAAVWPRNEAASGYGAAMHLLAEGRRASPIFYEMPSSGGKKLQDA